jgi:hypothetical protein
MGLKMTSYHNQTQRKGMRPFAAAQFVDDFQFPAHLTQTPMRSNAATP